jgi:GAF domain-containing protein
MKGLPLSAENATTAAFRTGVLQTVSADGDTNGAIAAPLVSPGGCLGVMSAEMRHNGEKQPDRLAAAMIVAAQLATIVGPPAARGEARGLSIAARRLRRLAAPQAPPSEDRSFSAKTAPPSCP